MGVIFSMLPTGDSGAQPREDLSKLTPDELGALITQRRPGSQRSIMAIRELIRRKEAIKESLKEFER